MVVIKFIMLKMLLACAGGLLIGFGMGTNIALAALGVVMVTISMSVEV